MAKEKFERNKPHCNIGVLQKSAHAVSQFLLLTLSMKQRTVTTRTLIAQATPITLKT